MNKESFTHFTHSCVRRLDHDGRFSTAHLYLSALRSFSDFHKTVDVPFSLITRRSLVSFELWLRRGGHRPNTISTYMRMLRAIYNKGVDAGLALYDHRLFHNVYTGVDSSHKRSLSRSQLHALLYGDAGSDSLRRAQLAARVLYQLCGMSFVDLAHADFSTVRDGVLRYSRHKTGTGVIVPVMSETLSALGILDLPRSDSGTRMGYTGYQSSLRRFNSRLSRLAHAVGVSVPVSSYTFRHSWATTALHRHVPVELISSALGHRSIKTTQIYLRGFDASEIGEVNRKIWAQRKISVG